MLNRRQFVASAAASVATFGVPRAPLGASAEI